MVVESTCPHEYFKKARIQLLVTNSRSSKTNKSYVQMCVKLKKFCLNVVPISTNQRELQSFLSKIVLIVYLFKF